MNGLELLGLAAFGMWLCWVILKENITFRITKDQTILFNTFATIVWLLVCVVLK